MRLGKYYEKVWDKESPEIWGFAKIKWPSSPRWHTVREKTEKSFERQRPLRLSPEAKVR